MKIFTPENSFRDKVNFADEHGVFVGFDMDQSCCECFGWFIQDHECNSEVQNLGEDYESYRFDVDYFKEFSGESYDEGGMVIFRLLSEGKPDRFLHLYNYHNGYYSHGFTFSNGQTVIHDGSL